MSDGLLFAVKSSDLEEVKSLIKDGTDINSTGQFGWTALHLAIYDGKREIIDWLLDQKADVNIKADDGCTALHYAVNYGSHALIESVITTHAADVNTPDANGKTSLMMAIENRDEQIIELLKKRGVTRTSEGNQ